ncbi:MAG: hypothetical protein ABIQ59_04865 [Nocardioidaceae bacterium]
MRGTLRAQFSDAQCGFEAIRSDVARELLPLVEDTAWFFDTGLLVLAERRPAHPRGARRLTRSLRWIRTLRARPTDRDRPLSGGV